MELTGMVANDMASMSPSAVACVRAAIGGVLGARVVWVLF
jgi:hypothetical protein